VLHSADVHLGSDGYGDAAQQVAHDERHRRAFRRVIELAVLDQVDLVLIAGDLFDHNRVPDELVAFVQAELALLRQPVVILPGNHDALYANALHDRHDLGAGVRHVSVGNISTPRQRSPRGWPPSPRHNRPDSDAGPAGAEPGTATRMLEVFHRNQVPDTEIVGVEQPFDVPLIVQETGEVLDRSLVGTLDLLERDACGPGGLPPAARGRPRARAGSARRTARSTRGSPKPRPADRARRCWRCPSRR
jgi:hypothetical protein